MPPPIIQNPPREWVRHLSEGCLVWLVKEKMEVAVVQPFTPPVGHARTGRLFLRLPHGVDYWFVSSEGRGIDGSLLMQPLEGSLPIAPVLLETSEAEQLRLEIEKLRWAVNELRSQYGLPPVAAPSRRRGAPVFATPSEGPSLWDNIQEE